MIHPIPSGTRDVLPEETREVRAITDTLRSVFEGHGYGEVYTPALEYESVLARADMAEAGPAYRVFDETGAVLALRSDFGCLVIIVAFVAFGEADRVSPRTSFATTNPAPPIAVRTMKSLREMLSGFGSCPIAQNLRDDSIRDGKPMRKCPDSDRTRRDRRGE